MFERAALGQAGRGSAAADIGAAGADPLALPRFSGFGDRRLIPSCLSTSSD
jgi:hypothetical protein